MARTALRTFAEAGVRFGVLHEGEKLQSDEPFGDIDVVVDTKPRVLVRRIGGRLAEGGAWPIVLWPYDVGGTASLFLMNANATGGAQIDMLHDPRGRGRYGLRSTKFEIDETVFPARVLPVDELVYVAIKRLRKAQADKLVEIRKRAAELGVEFTRAFERLVSSPALARAFGQPVPKKTAFEWAGGLADRVARLADRLNEPVGFWVHSDVGSIARDLADRFSRLLTSRAEQVPGGLGRAASWYWTTVAPLRWRAGLFASWGPLGKHLAPQPDLILSGLEGMDDPDLAAVLTVQAMTARILRQTKNISDEGSSR